ncbi:MAG TPA: glutamyl-tRNA reductase [Actinomycetes bacterium]
MSVLVVGLSHRTAPVDLLERMALTGDAAVKLLDDVVSSDHAGEAMVLSTCNRVEVYADVDKFHGGLAQTSELLARRTGVSLDELTPHLYVHYEDRAVAHLFAVACGLDSMVVGESQILGQVRTSLRSAQDAGTAGRTLGALAQQALRVGKRARTETGIDRAGRSLVSAGIEQAERVLGAHADTSALVVGAGAMSALAATVLSQAGTAEVVVANRTLSHGQRVAASVGGRAVPLSALDEAVHEADLVVSCTGAVGHVISVDLLAAAQETRDARPLVVLDLALPRDVEPGACDVPGVTVVDLETLAEALERTEHAADVEATRAIVADEVTAFLGWQRAASVAPTVVALRDMADGVVRAELARLTSRLPEIEDRVRAEIEQTVQRVVDKVLHAPTVRVKQLAGEPGGQSYADALGKLFGLDQAAVEAVTRADIEVDPTAAEEGPR